MHAPPFCCVLSESDRQVEQVYASSGGVIPSVTENEWAGNGVVRLRGWGVPGLEGDMVRGSSRVFGSA